MRVKVLTMQVLQSFGVFVVKKETFLVDLDELIKQNENVFFRLQLHAEIVQPIAMSLLRQLDRLVTETSGCESYINKFVNLLEKLINQISDNLPLK